jgi:hypothetical protein
LWHSGKQLTALLLVGEEVLVGDSFDFRPLFNNLGPELLFASIAKIFDLSGVRVASVAEVIEENINFEFGMQNFVVVFADSSGDSCILPAQM